MVLPGATEEAPALCVTIGGAVATTLTESGVTGLNTTLAGVLGSGGAIAVTLKLSVPAVVRFDRYSSVASCAAVTKNWLLTSSATALLWLRVKKPLLAP